jgi:hypothetical protein
MKGYNYPADHTGMAKMCQTEITVFPEKKYKIFPGKMGESFSFF